MKAAFVVLAAVALLLIFFAFRPDTPGHGSATDEGGIPKKLQLPSYQKQGS